MTNTIHNLKRHRDAGEINGFTLIEVLIVIVVLGILAAVLIFALGDITGKTAVAACQADGVTVTTAIADFNAQNAKSAVTTAGLLNGTSANGNSPYIQSWPSNTPHYAFELSTAAGRPVLKVSITPAGAVVASAQANYKPYAGPASCLGVS